MAKNYYVETDSKTLLIHDTETGLIKHAERVWTEEQSEAVGRTATKVTKRERTCSKCGKSGHTARTCDE